MRRIAAAGLSLAVAVGALVVGATVAASTATAATCTSTATVQITSIAFDPPSVVPGQSSTVSAVVQNCTSQDLTASVQWYAIFQGSTGSIPPGCVVYDPFIRQLTLPANGQATSSVTYSTFASCTATGLQATASVTAGGTTVSRSATLQLAGGSASPSTSASTPPPCAVSYARQSEWSGGFVAQVTVTNLGTTPINGWTLAFTFPGDQHITNSWNAALTQSGAAVSAANASYNAVIAPGASAAFGFQGTWHSSDASPTAFTLNRAACAVR
jgi:Cellulose binding domain